ncbi:MAG: CHAD domain-containing protein [Ignavibacteria bacterium]|nr:CHAD domain-containing protein [Ignavibacteria bacterium]
MAKAEKIPDLDPNAPLEECLVKILRKRFEEMISFEQGAIKGSNIDALHDMRVASRRVQAVLKIFRGVFLKKRFKEEYSELRSLIRSLGEVRDMDVFIEKLENMKESFNSEGSKNADNRAIDLLIIRKKTERDQKRKLLIQHINGLNRISYKLHFYGFVDEALL